MLTHDRHYLLLCSSCEGMFGLSSSRFISEADAAIRYAALLFNYIFFDKSIIVCEDTERYSSKGNVVPRFTLNKTASILILLTVIVVPYILYYSNRDNTEKKPAVDREVFIAAAIVPDNKTGWLTLDDRSGREDQLGLCGDKDRIVYLNVVSPKILGTDTVRVCILPIK